MDIEVLHIDDCASWEKAGKRLREALDAMGFDTPITYRSVGTTEDAAGVAFAGSPTILLDGEDLFSGGDRTTQLACRVYATPGGLAGTPTTQQIIDALVAHG